MNHFEPFQGQSYLNLETFRKTGTGVKTPVWFVQDGDRIYVRTIADSGKVKRIRNNARVNLAPCKVDGALLGDWVPAAAREVQDEATGRHINHLLDAKYGIVKKLFALGSALRRQRYTVLEIQADHI